MEKCARVALVLVFCLAAVCAVPGEGRDVPGQEGYKPQTFPGFFGGPGGLGGAGGLGGGVGGLGGAGGVGGAGGFPGIPGVPNMAGGGAVFGPLVPGFGNIPGVFNAPVAPGGGFLGAGGGGVAGHP